MVEHADVRRTHGYHELRVAAVVQETADTRSYVLDVPGDLADLYDFRAGQFCTFRVHVGDEALLRCYSMSSAPGLGLAVTVKRVPGGKVSNWIHDNVSEGDVLEVTPPGGVFCASAADDDAGRPIAAFCGGSGVTPVMSITRHLLATTDRPVTLLYANRDADSVIFRDALDELVAAHPEQLAVHHHLDEDAGFVGADTVARVAAEAGDADHFICGPTPFMDLVETTLLDTGVDRDRIAIERFVNDAVVGGVRGPDDAAGASDGAGDDGGDVTSEVTIVLDGKPTTVGYHAGDTVLQTARRGGLAPPFSCESGNCATCMALVREGSATMLVNNALTPEEVEEGWVLTCQALPEATTVTVEYESF